MDCGDMSPLWLHAQKFSAFLNFPEPLPLAKVKPKRRLAAAKERASKPPAFNRTRLEMRHISAQMLPCLPCYNWTTRED